MVLPLGLSNSYLIANSSISPSSKYSHNEKPIVLSLETYQPLIPLGGVSYMNSSLLILFIYDIIFCKVVITHVVLKSFLSSFILVFNYLFCYENLLFNLLSLNEHPLAFLPHNQTILFASYTS